MKRECLRLLADARSGDQRAQRVVAEHYLRGTAGFPKHLRLGVKYLSHPEIRSHRETSVLIARSLSLAELIEMDCVRHLQTAAACSDGTSLLKWAAWQGVNDVSGASVWPLLERACKASAPMLNWRWRHGRREKPSAALSGCCARSRRRGWPAARTPSCCRPRLWRSSRMTLAELRMRCNASRRSKRCQTCLPRGCCVAYWD